MDPTENLKRQRELAAEIVINPGLESAAYDLGAQAVQLAELATALDEWLTSGGYLPIQWQRRLTHV